MTPDQINLVQESFGQVAPIAETAADLFYNRLFELDPSLRALFPEDMRAQRRKLMQMLAVAVHGLRRPDTLLPAVEALGRRHAAYAVQPEHFDVVGAALLWTLAAGLGDAFTAEVREAWTVVYSVLADTMKAAMAEVTLPRAA